MGRILTHAAKLAPSLLRRWAPTIPTVDSGYGVGRPQPLSAAQICLLAQHRMLIL